MNLNGTEYKYTYNGEEVIVPIPAGFAVSGVEGENSVEDGLVIIDLEGNEFVWIEVPKSDQIYKITKTKVTDFDETFYTTIEEDLKNYTKDYRNVDTVNGEEPSDNWIEGCYLDEKKYNELKKSMLKSIYVNGGFWIGRYEVGYEGEVRYEPNNGYTWDVNVTPVVKKGAYPLNYICYPQAQKLSNNMTYGEYEGSLMFGIQFDLICKFIEEKHGKNEEEITKNCISWGNYRNAEFDIQEGAYSEDNGKTFEKVSRVISQRFI